MDAMVKNDAKRRGGMSSSAYGAGKKKLIPDKWRSGFEITVLSAPAIIIFLGFVIFPVFMAAYYGFYQWKGFGSPAVNGKFVGLGNYVTILKDPAFQQAVGHNFLILIMSLVVQMPLAVLFALLINQKMKGRALIRTLIFVPYVISEVIVGTGWSLILQTQGALNDLLGKIGIKGVDWISNPKIAIWTLIAIISWKYIGFYVILMLAGLQSIPEEMYEAAKVDGAGFWQYSKKHHFTSSGTDNAYCMLPVNHWLSAAIRFGVHHLGTVRFGDCWNIDHGNIHGP